jgi:hypothetical protein
VKTACEREEVSFIFVEAVVRDYELVLAKLNVLYWSKSYRMVKGKLRRTMSPIFKCRWTSA